MNKNNNYDGDTHLKGAQEKRVKYAITLFFMNIFLRYRFILFLLPRKPHHQLRSHEHTERAAREARE